MPIETLRRVWLAVALICLIICLDFFAVTQHWPMNFGTQLIAEITFTNLSDMRPSEVALLGLVFGLPLLCASLALAAVHARRMPGGPAEKFPFRLLDTDPATSDGKKVQIAAAVLFIAVPLYSVGHFWLQMPDQTICFNYHDRVVENLSIWATDWVLDVDHSPWRLWDNAFRYAPSLPGCRDGPTFQPLLEPILFVLVTVLALWLLARLIQALYFGGTAKQPDHMPW